MRRNEGGNYTNPCITMHQPWASLLVYGIKRIEGRSWPSPIRGQLWIHAAGKVPDPSTIKAMEEFYREIYAVDGITDLKFPESYPTSRLLGCVDVVGCVKREELQCWEEVPEGVRLEGQTDFCWLCEKPQRLVIPFEMHGWQGVYNLERKICAAAIRGLRDVETPFRFPKQENRISLKPGSKPFESGMTSSLSNAIAGAQVAATQFSKKNMDHYQSSMKPTSDTSFATTTRSKGRSQDVDNEVPIEGRSNGKQQQPAHGSRTMWKPSGRVLRS